MRVAYENFSEWTNGLGMMTLLHVTLIFIIDQSHIVIKQCNDLSRGEVYSFARLFIEHSDIKGLFPIVCISAIAQKAHGFLLACAHLDKIFFQVYTC